jgi:DNA-binding NarL/FixJ family response regulator
VDAVAETRRLYPKVKILVVSLHREDEYKRMCRQAGADGYVVKDAIAQELCDCMRAIFGAGPGPGATDAGSKYLPGSTALAEARDNFRH